MDSEHDLNSIDSHNDLECFYVKLIDRIKNCAFKNVRKKKKKDKTIFSWWTRDLAVLRNRATALFKRFKYLKSLNGDPDIISSVFVNYKKNRALYKRSINIAKKESWQSVCTSTTDKYGSAFKTVFGKLVRPGILVQAFADDLVMVGTGSTRRELETNINHLLIQTSLSLNSLSLSFRIALV